MRMGLVENLRLLAFPPRRFIVSFLLMTEQTCFLKTYIPLADQSRGLATGSFDTIPTFATLYCNTYCRWRVEMALQS